METKEVESIVNAIIEDRNGTGVRSRVPRYYIWENGRLWLVGWVGVVNFLIPAGSGSVHQTNLEVAEILQEMKIQYRFQNVIAHPSNLSNIHLYHRLSAQSVLESLHNSLKMEVKWGVRKRSILKKVFPEEYAKRPQKRPAFKLS